VIHAQAQRRAGARVLGSIASGWRNSIMPPQMTAFKHGGEEITVTYRARRNGGFDVSVGDTDYAVSVFADGADDTDLEINGRRVSQSLTADVDRWLVHGAGGDIEFEELPRFPVAGGAEFAGGLVAPMPGNVTATHVAEGDRVEEGQLLLILEAMKMEHRITAPIAGTVSQMRAAVGDQVDNGELLVVLEEEA